jgi:hypothetical protein
MGHESSRALEVAVVILLALGTAFVGMGAYEATNHRPAAAWWTLAVVAFLVATLIPVVVLVIHPAFARHRKGSTPTASTQAAAAAPAPVRTPRPLPSPPPKPTVYQELAAALQQAQRVGYDLYLEKRGRSLGVRRFQDEMRAVIYRRVPEHYEEFQKIGMMDDDEKMMEATVTAIRRLMSDPAYRGGA